MKVTKKFLNLPPYISTAWENVSSLFIEKKGAQTALQVLLTSGKTVEIPDLDHATLEAVFKAHAEHLEEAQNGSSLSKNLSKEQIFGFKLPLNLEGGAAAFGEMMQHNADQMHAPPMPQEVLSKIGAMIQMMNIDPALFPTPEPHCNCPHCQIARAIQNKPQEALKQEVEERVTDEELRFKDWEIEQKNDTLFRVTNPLDTDEHYDVFLGTPIGCTCGAQHCDHIRAVLRS